MPKKELVDFTINVTAKASKETIDKDVMNKAKKLVKDLENAGVKIQSSFISSGHTRGGGVDLMAKEAKADGDKE